MSLELTALIPFSVMTQFFCFWKTYKWVTTVVWLHVTKPTHSTHSLTCTWYIRVIEFKQRNTKSNCGSQHHKYKLFITQKSQLTSIYLRLMHRLYITKEWPSSKCYKSHRPHTNYTSKETIQVWPSTTQATSFSRSTPRSLQRSHPLHHQYLHP